MSFQQNVINPPRGFPGQYAGGVFYPAKSSINDATANVNCTISNFCWYIANATTTPANVTGSSVNAGLLAGLVLGTNQNVSYDASVIYFDTPITQIFPGQAVEFAVRGTYFANLQYVGAGTLAQGSQIWARNSDGAVAMGITTESGYTLTNFIAMDPISFNVLNGLIKISNSEKVTP